MLKIGCHVTMQQPYMFLSSVKEALAYDANCFMVFTGAPRNNDRRAIDQLYIKEAHDLMAINKLALTDICVHAPYTINLASDKLAEYIASQEILETEIRRTIALGVKYLILHPGTNQHQQIEHSLNKIIRALNRILIKYPEIVICLETMSGRPGELGKTFEELAYIINNVHAKDNIAVCLDTCHVHDAGYNLQNFDQLLIEFDLKIGLNKLKVIHLNDSKHKINSHMDRHQLFGYGHIGSSVLFSIAYHPQLIDVMKILESPLHRVNNRLTNPYQQEIKMIKERQFVDWKNRQLTFDI